MRLLLALLMVAVTPALAVAAIPDDLSGDPLDRGALVALPGVYELEARFTVESLSTRFEGEEELEIDGPITVAGSAFGIATGGWILTADHLVNGTSATLAIAALSADPQARERLGIDDLEEWVEQSGARPVGVRRVDIRLRHVQGALSVDPLVATLQRSEPAADMALLLTDRPDAPTLELDDSQSVGTPVVTIGFGGDEGATRLRQPVVRPGELASTGTIAGRGTRLFTQVTSAVQRGDSGGPAVDADGRVRGMVITRARVGANLVPGPQIRAFIGAERVEVSNGTQESYREGLAHFWALDFDAARTAMERALEAYPQHPLAGQFIRRSTELTDASVSLSGPDAVRSFLRAIALVAALIALGLGALVIRHDMHRREPPALPTPVIDEDGP